MKRVIVLAVLAVLLVFAPAARASSQQVSPAYRQAVHWHAGAVKQLQRADYLGQFLWPPDTDWGTIPPLPVVSPDASRVWAGYAAEYKRLAWAYKYWADLIWETLEQGDA